MTIDTTAEKSYCCYIRSSKTRMIFCALGITALLLLLNACGLTGGNQAKITTSTTTTTTGSGPTMRVSTGGLAWGVVGVSYSASLSATGGTAPYSWQLTSGSLPSGLVMNTAGQITGNPQTAATSTFTLQAKDSAALTATSQFTLTIVTPGSLDGPALLPKITMNTTFPSQASANVFTVVAGNASDLQAHINTAAANCGSTGAIVNVPSGNTYTASTSFNLPPTNCDATHWVIIQSDHLSSLPAQGTRISSSNANMPTLVTSNPTLYPVIIAADNPTTPLGAMGAACTASGGGASTVPCGYWLSGLEITQSADVSLSGADQLALIHFGEYCGLIGGGGCPISSGMTKLNLGSRFTVDRCWIHGHSVNSNLRHGIRFTASYVAVEDSLIGDIHSNQSQATGISSDFSFGPLDVGNTEIMAAGEGMLFGATDPTIPNSIVSDIYVHQNYIHKPVSWWSTWIVNTDTRNWLECKSCQRLMAEGNVFDSDIGRSQSAALQFTPRTASGKCPWCTVTDITIRYNKMSNMTDWITIIGANGATSGGSQGPELPSKRFSVHDNVVENVNSIWTGTTEGNGRLLQIEPNKADSTACSGTPNTDQCRLSDIMIAHNTVVGADGAGNGVTAVLVFPSTPTASDLGYNFAVTDNIFPAGSYLQNTDLSVSPHPLTAVFNAYFSSFTFDHNAITGASAAGYSCNDFPSPIQNFCTGIGQPPAMANIGFTNWNSGSGGNYQLCFGIDTPAGCTAASPYHNAADDGTDVGANISLVNSHTNNVIQGTPTPP